MIEVTPEKLVPYIDAQQIESLNAELGRRITADYRNYLEPGSELLVVVTLKGALFFAADLVRHIKVPVRMDFVRLASYGAGTKSSGTVRILKDIETHIQGQDILVLDEIVDSGRTLRFLVDRLKASGPKSIKVCSLLSKPSRREVPIDIDYLGREVEDRFLIGYGLDYNENHRNWKDIVYLKE